MIISRVIHFAASGIIPFFFLALYDYTVHIYHIFFIHSSVEGTAVNTGVHLLFQIRIFSGYISRNGIAGSYWGRKWQPTPVFLPEKSHRQRSLVSYSPHQIAKNMAQWLNHYHHGNSMFSFLIALGLCCCKQAFSNCDQKDLLCIAAGGLVGAVASLVMEHGF